jgi:hypothetical protein
MRFRLALAEKAITNVLKRSLLAATLVGIVSTPAIAEWRLPCIIGGCSIIFGSPEDLARPVQPLNPEAALAEGQRVPDQEWATDRGPRRASDKGRRDAIRDSGHARLDRP